MIADPFRVVDAMYELGYKTAVLFNQVFLRQFDEETGDLVLQCVDFIFPLLYFFDVFKVVIDEGRECGNDVFMAQAGHVTQFP